MAKKGKGEQKKDNDGDSVKKKVGIYYVVKLFRLIAREPNKGKDSLSKNNRIVLKSINVLSFF